MAYSHYERLSALDQTFLAIEDHNVHMHVGSVAIFDAEPLRTGTGALDMERIRINCEAGLHRQPRFLQKLAWVPIFNYPVWVDDDRFNLNYHLRHTNLPVPGDVRRLKRLAGRIMSQKLDQGKPLWEMWFVDGVEGNRFAIISKVHHCMIDGVSGVDLMGSVMDPTPDAKPKPAKPWLPRPAPSRGDLLRDEIARRAAMPLEALRSGLGALSDPGQAYSSLRQSVSALGEAIGAGLTPADPTPLNPDIGPHRRFDWTQTDLRRIKEIRNALGGTVNDVVLACISGALRHFLRSRGLRVNKINFRSMVPVNIRAPEERGALGNRVSFLLAQLPLEERDPKRRLQRVIEITQGVKRSKQAQGAEVLERISDWTVTSLLIQYANMAAKTRSYNMVVTNVPGPPGATYMSGAKMTEVYPLVPLFANQALGIALFSYDGVLYWGFNCDWDALPDLHDLVEAVDEQFQLLHRIATETSAAGGGKKTGKRRVKTSVAEGSASGRQRRARL